MEYSATNCFLSLSHCIPPSLPSLHASHSLPLPYTRFLSLYLHSSRPTNPAPLVHLSINLLPACLPACLPPSLLAWLPTCPSVRLCICIVPLCGLSHPHPTLHPTDPPSFDCPPSPILSLIYTSLPCHLSLIDALHIHALLILPSLAPTLPSVLPSILVHTSHLICPPPHSSPLTPLLSSLFTPLFFHLLSSLLSSLPYTRCWIKSIQLCVHSLLIYLLATQVKSSHLFVHRFIHPFVICMSACLPPI